MKRTFANLQLQQAASSSKRIRLEDPCSSVSSDTESILSIQNKSTDYAEDTEDTSDTPSVLEDESGMYRRRFVVSSSDESEVEEIADLGAVVAGAVLENNLDIGLADTSEECSTSPTSNSDVDPGLPRSDYLDFEKCQMCKTNDKDTNYPYCLKCYKLKKSFFPPRPNKKRRKFSLLHSKGLSYESSDATPGTGSELMQSSQDSGISSCQGLTESESSGKSPERTDSGVDVKNLCEICFEKKRNGLFIHGNSSHLYGCYQCAKTSWYSTGGCPLCRKKVKQVMKLLNYELA